LPFKLQSQGTKKIITFLLLLLKNIKQNNKVILVDEIENSIHPLLLKHFIKKLLEMNNNFQIIFTTHYDPLLEWDDIPRIKIIGDGLTEYYYFKHLKKLKYQRANIELKRSYFGSKDIMTKIKEIKSDLKGVYSIIIIVFDIENDENKKKIFEERIKLLKNIEVLGLYSNPSIEYWFLLHYTDENRSFNAEELKKYLKPI